MYVCMYWCIGVLVYWCILNYLKNVIFGNNYINLYFDLSPNIIQE